MQRQNRVARQGRRKIGAEATPGACSGLHHLFISTEAALSESGPGLSACSFDFPQQDLRTAASEIAGPAIPMECLRQIADNMA